MDGYHSLHLLFHSYFLQFLMNPFIIKVFYTPKTTVQEPKGETMTIDNSSLLLDIPAGEANTAKFEPRIPLNV